MGSDFFDSKITFARMGGGGSEERFIPFPFFCHMVSSSNHVRKFLLLLSISFLLK